MAVVRSRSIYNVRYDVPAAKIVSGPPQTVSTQTIENGSAQSATVSHNFTFILNTTTSWNATVSSGVPTTLTARIPVVENGSITTGREFSGAYVMGEEHTSSVTMEANLAITIPPMTRVIVSMIESRYSYDVPFAFTQEEIMSDQSKVVVERQDGLAIGSNNDMAYSVVEQPIERTSGAEGREYKIVPQTSRIVADPASAAAE